MLKGIIVLGNGFDLDLGLQTSYSDFAKSRYWTELMDANPRSSDNGRLLGCLRERYDAEKWIDIEKTLLEFALAKTKNRDVSRAKDDQEDFILLRAALKKFLLEQQGSFSAEKNSVAKVMLKMTPRLTKVCALYTFNYTQLDVLANKIGVGLEKDAVHIHGSLKDGGDLILGIDTKEMIAEEYSFLFKTQNRQYRHTDILKSLRDKAEYVFFGHSLNGMDYSYFSLLFSHLTVSVQTTPRLTIITKNEDEENRFKNFLRRSHVSLQELYSNSNPTFILTDEVYKQSGEELDKLNALLTRLIGI